MNRILIWAFLFLAVTIQLPAQQPATVSVETPDGSEIKANADRTVADSVKIKTQAENGDPEAQVTLGFNIIESGVLKFDREAAKWVRRTGDTNAAEKATEAAKWFRRAADQGNAFAENNLGACYANGLGVGKDEAEAAKWYRKAAEQDDADAQYWLGRAYETGRGVETNIVEAAKWYDKAAENQNIGAQEWIRKAAMNGDASAQCSLGNLYDDGSIGVEEELKDRPGVTANYHRKNHIEAVKWYRRAAAQGNAAAEFFLGLMYDNGQGVPQDYVEAYKWYNLAAAQGLAEEQGASPAITNRDAIARYMTPDQIAEAQQLSREFKPRKEFGSDNSSSPEEPTATGTGFFITDDGYLISNFLC